MLYIHIYINHPKGRGSGDRVSLYMVIVRNNNNNNNNNQIEKEKKGMQLGKYQLGRTLGEGNFGKVKLAQDLESGKPFAVKILEKNRIIDLKITDQVHPFPS